MNNDPFSQFHNLLQRSDVWEDMSEDNTRIWGDFATRIKNVYEANFLIISTQWCKS